MRKRTMLARLWRLDVALLVAAICVPIADAVAMRNGVDLGLTSPLPQCLVFAILALGLNVVTGFTGMLHLGMAAFMAIGAYAYGILTCDIYPFQLGFWMALAATTAIGVLAGLLLGAPTMALRGDYLAIVTLGFGEIAQDVLKNLESITQGTLGINPLPGPVVVGVAPPPGDPEGAAGLRLIELNPTMHPAALFYLYLAIVVLAVVACRNLERSRTGRAWLAIRGDELAARCMGIPVVRMKMLAFATGAALAAIAGALWASFYTSTGEPANYDFQVSVLALCIVIVGGMGSITGVLVGTVVVVGFANILLPRATGWMQARDWVTTTSTFGNPNNWKYLIFGLALVLMMRFRPDGLLPRRAARSRGGDRTGGGPGASRRTVAAPGVAPSASGGAA